MANIPSDIERGLREKQKELYRKYGIKKSMADLLRDGLKKEDFLRGSWRNM